MHQFSEELEPHKELPATGPGLESVAGLRRKAVRGGTLLLLSRLFTQVFVWASTLLIARFLSPLDYGLMSIGLLFVGLADLFAEAGISGALIQKEQLETRDVDEGFTLNLLLSIVMYLCLFALAEPVANHVFDSPELPLFLRVLGLHVLLAPFMAIPLALLDRSLSMGKQSAIHVGTSVFQSSVVLCLAIVGFGYWSLVAGSILRRIVEVACYIGSSGWRPRLAPLSARVAALLRFGIHATVGTFLWYLYSNVDYAFVGKYSGPLVLGFYALAFQLISLPAEKMTANINKIAYPTFCRLQNDRPRLHDWFVRLQVLIGFLGMPMMAGMALVAEDGLSVALGETWLPAVLPFQLLSLSGLVRIYSGMYPMLWTALGRPDLSLKYNLVCALFLPACYFVAGWAWGMIGVCLVWTIVFPLVVMSMIHWTREVTTVRLFDLFWSQRAIMAGTVFMAVIVLAVQGALPEAPRIIRLAAGISAGVLAYAAPMVLFCRHTILGDLWLLWREVKSKKSSES